MTHVVENVRFRLKEGVSADTFLEANKAVETWLSTQDGFVTRTLSQGADDEWLDHVEWTSMQAAKAASEAMMQEPSLAAFGAAISGDGLDMRHHMLRWKG